MSREYSAFGTAASPSQTELSSDNAALRSTTGLDSVYSSFDNSSYVKTQANLEEKLPLARQFTMEGTSSKMWLLFNF